MTRHRHRHLACLKGIEKDAAEDYLIMYQTTEKKKTEIEELSGETGLGLGLRDEWTLDTMPVLCINLRKTIGSHSFLRVSAGMFWEMEQKITVSLTKRDTSCRNVIRPGLKLCITLRYMAEVLCTVLERHTTLSASSYQTFA